MSDLLDTVIDGVRCDVDITFDSHDPEDEPVVFRLKAEALNSSQQGKVEWINQLDVNSVDSERYEDWQEVADSMLYALKVSWAESKNPIDWD